MENQKKYILFRVLLVKKFKSKKSTEKVHWKKSKSRKSTKKYAGKKTKCKTVQKKYRRRILSPTKVQKKVIRSVDLLGRVLKKYTFSVLFQKSSKKYVLKAQKKYTFLYFISVWDIIPVIMQSAVN